MRRHFMYRHPLAAVHFPREPPLQQCPQCPMQVPSVKKHQGTKLCIKAAERATKRAQKAANQAADLVVFTVDGVPIESVPSFCYLGWVLAANDDDLPAIQSNIRKARQRWGQVSRLLARDGASTRIMGYFYKAVVQAVLLYGAKTWVLSERMRQLLASFHHRCARHIAREPIRQLPDGTWVTPRSSAILEKCGLFTIDHYVKCRKDTVKAFVTQCSIYDICKHSAPMAINANQLVWW